jgi:MFS family permease
MPIWSALRNRSFVALALAISGTSMTQTAVLQTLLPIHAQHRLGVDEIGVGLLITVAAVLSFLVAFPNGMMSDRFGRKVSFVPGLLLLTAAMTVLTVTDAYVFLLLAVAIQGAGEGMTMGTSQTYAMDLAPPDRRGAFLGIVMMFQASGAFAGPLVIGALYSSVGPSVGFGTLAVWLTVAAMAMAVLARETAGSRRVDPGAAGRR